MSEDIFTLTAQVQAVIERAKEDAKMLRDGSFRDNAMQVIVELDSRLKQAQQREQAAYERGKTEGLEEGKRAERGRIEVELKAELKALDGQYDDDDLGAQGAFQDAIAIVNQE